MFLLYTAYFMLLFHAFVSPKSCAKIVGYTYMRNVCETRVPANNTRKGVRRLLALW